MIRKPDVVKVLPSLAAEASPRRMELETLYSSPSPQENLAFYFRMESVEEMLSFFRGRARPEVRIAVYERRGSDGLVVVAPTENIDSFLARGVTASYPESTIILVESRGPYFNFSYAMNLGIREALERNPQYVLLTNDDVWPLGQISAAVQEALQRKLQIAVPIVRDAKGVLLRQIFTSVVSRRP